MHFPEYVCPKCGFFNPSARSKKLGLRRTPSPPANVDTDSIQSPQPAPMEGVGSTKPTVDTTPEVKDWSRSREIAGHPRGEAMQAKTPTS
jgi:hypothetical protein